MLRALDIASSRGGTGKTDNEKEMPSDAFSEGLVLHFLTPYF